MVKRKIASPTEALEVEEVKDSKLSVPSSDAISYVVKLDSRRFEGRTMEQVFALITGSEGIVSKVTIERE